MRRVSPLLLCSLLSWQMHAQERIRWNVEDQIAIERLPSHLEADFSPPFHYSGNGDLVAFVTLKPDSRTDETIARLRVFETSDLRSFASGVTPTTARPVFDYSVRSRGNRPGIGDLKWTPEGATLLFLAQETGRRNALYRWRRDDSL